jgi:hypothetical protein
MNIIKIACCFCILYLLQACNEHPAKTTDNGNKDSVNLKNIVIKDTIYDTAIVVHWDGKAKGIVVHKNNVEAAKAIEKLAPKFKNRPLDSTVTRLIDITGDGEPEKIVCHTWVNGDSVYGMRTIYRKDKIIFSNTTKDWLKDTVNNDVEGQGIEQDMVPFEPFASFYNIIQWADINNDIVELDLSTYEANAGSFAGFVGYADMLRQRHVNESDIKKKVAAIKAYYPKFKGAVLSAHDEEYPIVMIWYEPEMQFITFL